MYNHCLATMSHNENHFKDLKVKQIRECTCICTGLTIAGKGNLLMNDNGRIHKIEIPNSLYVPSLWMVLLSPQHWNQQAKETVPHHWEHALSTVICHVLFIGIKRSSKELSHLMRSPTLHLSILHLDAFIIELLPQHLKPWRNVMSLEKKPSYCQI